MDFSQLKEKVIVIIGASRGIGKATAEILNQYEAKLVLGSRDITGITKEFTREEIYPLEVDVRDEQSVMAFVDQIVQRFGRIDVLINAAGMGTFSHVVDSNTQDFDDMIAVNLRGTYFTCKHFGKHMKQQQDGQILNLVSIAGTTALAGGGGYSASKFGVLGLTRVLQNELRTEGVRITSVLPGAVNSSFWDDIDPKPDVTNMIPAQSIAEHIAFLLCQPKQSVVDEITIMPPEGIL